MGELSSSLPSLLQLLLRRKSACQKMLQLPDLSERLLLIQGEAAERARGRQRRARKMEKRVKRVRRVQRGAKRTRRGQRRAKRTKEGKTERTIGRAMGRERTGRKRRETRGSPAVLLM